MIKKIVKISKKKLGVSLLGIILVGAAATAAMIVAKRPGRIPPRGNGQQVQNAGGGDSLPAAAGQLKAFAGDTLPEGWPPHLPIEHAVPVLRNGEEIRDGRIILMYAYRSKLGIEANYAAFKKYVAENAWQEAIAGVSDNGKELAAEREGQRLMVDISKDGVSGSIVSLSLFRQAQK